MMCSRRWMFSTWITLCLFSLSGCVTSGYHKKVVAGLNATLDKLKGEKSELEKTKTDLEGKLEAKTGELKSMTDKRDSLAKQHEEMKAKLESQIQELEKANQQCSTDLKSLAKKRGKLSKRLTQAIDQIQRLRKIAQKRQALFKKLKRSLKAMVDAGDLRVQMKNGMLIVQLAEKILFATGKHKLKKEGAEAIAKVTRVLKGQKQRWQVTGHTDTTGDKAFNWKLSTQRALAVLQIMLKNEMPPENVSAAGYGQYQPTTTNDTKENKALNRRTELVLVPNLQELQLAANPSPFWVCKALAQRTTQKRPL